MSTIINVDAAITAITMHYYYFITANFALEILEIWDWHDLHTIRDNLGGSYILTNDLDSTTAGYEELASPTANEGKGWQSIGTLLHPFTGTFDGQGYEIRDPFINRPDEDRVGLFGFVDEGGRIEHIGVVNAEVSGHYGVGGLVGGSSLGIVSNSYSTSSVTGEEGVGGLVGVNEEATVSSSFWDTETSGQATSDGGTGKTTAEMQDIATFTDTETEGLDEAWDITAVAPGVTDTAYTWNIVDGQTYPFLSWESVS